MLFPTDITLSENQEEYEKMTVWARESEERQKRDIQIGREIMEVLTPFILNRRNEKQSDVR